MHALVDIKKYREDKNGTDLMMCSRYAAWGHAPKEKNSKCRNPI